MQWLKIGFTSVLALAAVASWNAARAGTIILEGSDAIGYHCAQESEASACTYRDQVWNAIGGSDPRSIAVIGSVYNLIGDDPGFHAIDTFPTVAAAIAAGGASGLSDYVALYFLAGGGCCAEDDSLVTGQQTNITNYLNAGGTVMIENYIGGQAWNFAVDPSHLGANLNTDVAGFDGGQGGFSCSDGETVTAAGKTNGFTQPGILNCWTHQAYDENYFGPLGFTDSFFNSPPGLPTSDPYSSLLSDGETVTGVASSVPEPSSVALLGAGLVALGFRRRRQAA